MASRRVSKRVSELTNSVDNYEASLSALLAFINNATWDDKREQPRAGTKYSLGRRMTASSQNRVSPNGDVTPDAVVQRDPTNGVVCEVKMNIARSADGRIPAFRVDELRDQIRRYDDDLTGWFTPKGKVAQHDMVVLCDLMRATALADVLRELEEKEHVRCSLALVAAVRATQAKEYIELKKEHGRLSDAAWGERLRQGVAVPVEKLAATQLGRIRYYDARPECPLYTMMHLWMHVFPEMSAPMLWQGARDGSGLEATVEELTRKLQAFFGPTPLDDRDVALPRPEWVKEAMDMFVNIGKAEKVHDSTYRITCSRLRSDHIESFARRIEKWEKTAKRRLSKTHAKQGDMFQAKLPASSSDGADSTESP